MGLFDTAEARLADLTLGHTYSIQIQVRDAMQQHVYTADERAWVHLNEYPLLPPTLTPEVDTDSHTQVELTWAAPAVNDGDALTYELVLTRTYGGAAYPPEYYSTADTSLLLGYMYPGTYEWTVKAIDEHDLESAYATADIFVIDPVGVVPTIDLKPWGPSINPLVTTWGFYDADGDAQTAYQVQVASDDEFATIVQDSGEVASTDQFYQHATLTAGTYYRRAKMQTSGVDWSDWDSDSVNVTAPTTQTDELDIYLDAAGTPTALDLDAYPVSGVSLLRRLDGPSEFRFTVDNFDGTEAGIADDDELLVYIKDSNGKRIEFRGGITVKGAGDLIEVEAKDIARFFDRWKVERWLYNKSIAQIIAAMVENPTGRLATGIVAHCDEIAPEDAPGDIVRAKMFVGGKRTVSEWLAEFMGCTGYRWYIESVAGVYHFHWCNPNAMPELAATLTDDTDRAADTSVQWRVKDGFSVNRTPPIANKVNYQASLVPPEPPYGYLDYDSWLSEPATLWTAWNAYTTIAQDSDIPTSSVSGSKSIKFTYERTQAGAVTWPTYMPLGYFRLPLDWQDQSTLEWGAWRAKLKCRLWINGVEQDEDDLPQSGVNLYYICSSASLTTPPSSSLASDGSATVGAAVTGDLHPPWSNWMSAQFSPLRIYRNAEVVAGVKHVVAIGIGYKYWGGGVVQRSYQDQMVPPPTVPAGQAVKIEVWLDDLMVTSSQWKVDGMVDDVETKAPPTIDLSIETAAVTAGTAHPIDADINTAGLSRSEAGKLAAAKLAEVSRVRRTVSALSLDGIRNIPLRSLVPLELAEHGLTGVSWPLAQVEYKLWEAGDETTLTVGDVPVDERRSLERLRTLLEKLKSEVMGG